MTIPKKGSRLVTVGKLSTAGPPRHKTTYYQEIWGDLTFAVELVTEGNATTLGVQSQNVAGKEAIRACQNHR